jgi:hypothetical protein
MLNSWKSSPNGRQSVNLDHRQSPTLLWMSHSPCIEPIQRIGSLCHKGMYYMFLRAGWAFPLRPPIIMFKSPSSGTPVAMVLGETNGEEVE